MRTAICSVLLFLMAAPSWAAAPGVDRENKLVISKEVIAVALQQPPSAPKPGFDDWSTRIERAQGRRDNGKKWLLTGVLVSGAGVLLAGLNKAGESHFGGTADPANTSLAAMGMIAGVGIAGYGGYRYAQARGDIEELEREGRTKGYLTLLPLPEKGIRVAIHLSF